MNYAREGHSCATMRLNNKTFIVVLGTGSFFDESIRIEILDTSLPTNTWKIAEGIAPCRHGRLETSISATFVAKNCTTELAKFGHPLGETELTKHWQKVRPNRELG